MRENQDKTFSELLAEAGERDGFKVEWFNGKFVLQASASAFHSLIISETTRQIPADRWWSLPDMGVGLPANTGAPYPTSWSLRPVPSTRTRTPSARTSSARSSKSCPSPPGPKT
jgi:hypothetical protein